MKRLLLLFILGCNSGSAAVETIPSAAATTASEAPAPTVESTATAEPAPPQERLLAQFTTRFLAGPKVDGRVQNISLLATKLADVTVAPGQEFSFNQTVGPRTEALGFKSATTLFMGEKTEGIGGGSCQVSSTLYAAVMHAGVTITDRRPHSRPSAYIEQGLDATVSYPKECQSKKPDPAVCYDLKFSNPYSFPLHIRSEVSQELDKDEKRSLTISVFGDGITPKIETQWKAWSTPPFEPRYRRVHFWKNDRKRLKQAGQPGLEGARYWTLTYADGHVEKREVISRYKPVPEVWEVGMEWQDPEAVE